MFATLIDSDFEAVVRCETVGSFFNDVFVSYGLKSPKAYPIFSPFGTSKSPIIEIYLKPFECKFYFHVLVLPIKMPIENNIINGLRRPKLRRHRSLKEPMIGVKKNPTNGDSAQTRVMC